MENKKPVIIIAEAGVNHNGKLHLAKEMVEKAKAAGADYIKFQTFVPEGLATCKAEKAQYQKGQTGDGPQLDMLRTLALPNEAFVELKRHCDQSGIGFLSAPFDLESIEFLSSFDMDYWKVPSGEITNLPYLEKIGRTRKKVILSTGMSELDEIRAAVDILEENGSFDITILHCNTGYPTPFIDVNLLAMRQIRSTFHKTVGYSDHTEGIEVPIAAAALGAKVIEKHFTLDRAMEGPDHRASLEPEGFSAMVKAIRNIETALGDGKKKRTASEVDNIKIVRKSIVAAKRIKAGETLTEGNITAKRPGTGISPMEWHEVLGKKAARDYMPDELIQREQTDV